MKRFHLIFLIVACWAAVAQAQTVVQEQPDKVYDAIIVPGYPYHPNAKLNVIYRMRLHWAHKLYSEGRARHIIVSGGAVHTPYVEAQIFSLYLQEMGVDPAHIITEEMAEHSLENIHYSLQLADELGFEHVAVATDLFQSGMIRFLGKKYKKHGLKVDHLPANTRYVLKREWKSLDLIIDAEMAFVENFTPLKERLSRRQRLEGTRGMRLEEGDLTLGPDDTP